MERWEPDGDHVDRLRAQWARELPDLDTTPMGIFGRAYRLSTLVAPHVTEIFRAFGIDRGEFDVLATLRRSGAPYRLTPTEIYRSLMISSGGLTHRLGRLEAAGLIARDPSDVDGRSLAVRLTDLGKERVEAAFRADMTEIVRLLDPLTYAEKKTLADLLRKLLKPLEQNTSSLEAAEAPDSNRGSGRGKKRDAG
jgi:DNA-binding MarR family transcriptional regulator